MRINVVDLDELRSFLLDLRSDQLCNDAWSILEKFEHAYGLDIMKESMIQDMINTDSIKQYKIVIESYILDRYLNNIYNEEQEPAIITLKYAMKDTEFKREVHCIQKGNIKICQLLQE